ncbi:DNA translocase FtsK [Staphylococcus auricularis]|uniref:DNA translocase FtsK n=1 Tax=Staphylococcus auricularis TaxID=29379 RepID=UPI002DBB6311|nr:DNA translocase FtsK [Staphylococcus auricularis]MEB6569149.1 DNA translocase FtsK [Staphylococcus auricularis]
MSWFDKLFGEDNESNDKPVNKRQQRREKIERQQKQDSLLSQHNDIYNRPRGRFRFPIQINTEESSQKNDDKHIDYAETSDIPTYNTQDDAREQSRETGHTRRHRRINQPQGQSSESSRSDVSEGEDNTPRYERPTSQERRTRHRTTSDQSKRETKAKRTTPESTPLTREFRVSEVPSSVFGNRKRRKIENGVIPPAEDNDDDKATSHDEATESESQHHSIQDNTSRDRSVSYGTESDQDEQTVTHQSNDTETRRVQQSENKPQATQSETPSYSKQDNTINIENIYASQIVEEIRRERERKILQKRQFKKALQQKREEHNKTNEDGIQKAIDEMYAKQAKNLTGESSLDEAGAESEADHQSDRASNHQADTTQDQPEAQYRYEEVNLDDVHTSSTTEREIVNDVEDDKNYQETQQPEIDTEATEADHQLDMATEEDTTTSDDSVAASTSQDHQGKTASTVETEESEDVNETEVSEAQYREIPSDDNESTTEESDTSNHSAADGVAQTELHMETDEDHEEATSDDNETSETDSEVSTESSTDTEDEGVQTEGVNSDETSASEVNDDEKTEAEHESSDEQKEVSEKTTEETHNQDDDTEAQPQDESTVKSSIQKGSKPFNVVMTPSDKKRMLDAKKAQVQANSQIETLSEDISTENEASTPVSNEDTATETHEASSISNLDSETESSHDTEHETEAYNEAEVTQTEPTESSTSQRSTAQTSSKHRMHFDERPSRPAQNQNEVNGSSRQDNQQQDEGSTITQSEPMISIRKGPNINLPKLDLLEEPEAHEVDEAWIEEKKQQLNDSFYYFNVPAEVQNVTVGPSVTRFELSVEKGVKVSRITNLQDDLKMALAAKDIRIEAPIPGTSLVGIEVPNQDATKVNLRSIIESQSFKNAQSKLTVAMGLRINNEPLLMDIAKTPHALIAGATGSGKSVCINSILISLLYKNHPEELRLLLIDPKMVELAPYNDLPHLISPVITDVKAATQSLKWAVEEMERRYKLFANYHVRNITAFNKKANYEDRMPKIVIVIDELADLMMMAPQDVEQSIARIAQKARACGIHMLVATQRPSVNVITGLIKANIPTRIAFMVSSSVDSRTILDNGGAERLLGYGDMLYLGSGMNKPIRVQGSFVSDDEIDKVVDFIKQQREPQYLFEEKELLKKTEGQAKDDLFDDVCRFMVKEGHISTSLIQRHFQIGYNRAARIVDQLEELGYISEANGSKPRDVYITESDLDDI